MTDERPQARRKSGLGRGLDALLGDVGLGRGTVATADADAGSHNRAPGQVRSIPIAEIRPHPGQPRRHFSEDALAELATSIAERGIIQPIVVRPQGRGYQIVAGERRWRAAQRARLHEVPAIVRDFTDSETLEIALIENIQREELNPIEEAEAYKKLVDEFGHAQAEIARLVDKSRSHIANLMRLLELPESVREMVVDRRLSMGHARALVNHDNAMELAKRVIDDELSVRQLEGLVRQSKTPDKAAPSPVTSKTGSMATTEKSTDIAALEDHLTELLGVKVSIESLAPEGAGYLRLEFSNLDQLDMLCQRLTGESF